MDAGSGLPISQMTVAAMGRVSGVRRAGQRIAFWLALLVTTVIVAAVLRRRRAGHRHQSAAIDGATGPTSPSHGSDHAVAEAHPDPDEVQALEEAAERSSWTWPWPPEDPPLDT